MFKDLYESIGGRKLLNVIAVAIFLLRAFGVLDADDTAVYELTIAAGTYLGIDGIAEAVKRGRNWQIFKQKG